MTHPLVDQIRFARSEFKRGLDGVTDADGRERVGPANSISWTIGHLAWQEQRYWLQRLHGVTLVPELDQEYCFGCPPSTPPLDRSWQQWEAVVAAVDPHLDELTGDVFLAEAVVDGRSLAPNWGSLALRVIYHYWFHLGETQGIRQALGHGNLAQFVGDIDGQAPYRA